MMYRGIVEANDSPTKDGRVRVRIFGLYGSDVTTEQLPWAEVMQGIDYIGAGKGKNTIIEIGTWVMCMLDHTNPNMPIVIGTIAAHNDINVLSNPKNQVTETASGHLIEIDDNEGNERIHIKHKTGTLITLEANGKVTIDAKANMEIIGDLIVDNIQVKGDISATNGTFTAECADGKGNMSSLRDAYDTHTHIQGAGDHFGGGGLTTVPNTTDALTRQGEFVWSVEPV